jgi:hypothetical protein
MLFALTGIALANPVSKTIDTTACTSNPAEQCATYGADGFTGTITFSADQAGDTVMLADVICVNPIGVQGDPATGGGFNTVGITGGVATGASGSSAEYTLTLDGHTYAPYTVDSGFSCSDGQYDIFGDIAGVSFVVPADLTVDYSISITGVTDGNAAFGDKGVRFNSILNKLYEQAGNPNGSVSVNSPSVGPPEGPPPVVPEAPLTVLLLLTGGVTTMWYVSRKLRQSVPLSAA